MTAIKRILFPIDFSDRCCAAVPFVEAMASRYGAKITLISVADPTYYAGMGDPGGPLVFSTETILSDLKERLESALTRELAQLNIDRVAVLGDPARVITQFAHDNGVDLIMMPTHGYGPFRQFLLGSVTAKVLHDAECPVWTAAHVEQKPCQSHVACRNILCAVDGTPKSEALMRWASNLAHDLGATLRLVHVIAGTSRSVMHNFDAVHEEELRERAHRIIEKLKGNAQIGAPLCVIAGTLGESVQEEARRHGADLVIIGRGALHEKLGRLRAHSYGIIRQSPCPVLSV